MAAITDLSDYINLSTGGGAAMPQHLSWFSDGRVGSTAAAAEAVARPKSLWHWNTTRGSGAIPGAAAAPNNTTLGGLRQANPGGGRQLWLTGAMMQFTNAGTWMLYDRLLHNGGLSGTVITAQAVGGTLTRYTNGVGNMLAVEIYTAIGGTGTTAVINYTNQDGNPAVTPSFVIGGAGFREAGRMIFVPLASGDSGVQGVTDIDLLASTTVAGSFGVTVVHPLLTLMNGGAGYPSQFDPAFMRPGVVEVLTDACLAQLLIPSATSATTMAQAYVTLTEK